LAFVTGSLGGILIRATGAKSDAYEDEDEFFGAQADAPAQ
jgi:hypothetical protein